MASEFTWSSSLHSIGAHKASPYLRGGGYTRAGIPRGMVHCGCHLWRLSTTRGSSYSRGKGRGRKGQKQPGKDSLTVPSGSERSGTFSETLPFIDFTIVLWLLPPAMTRHQSCPQGARSHLLSGIQACFSYRKLSFKVEKQCEMFTLFLD